MTASPGQQAHDDLEAEVRAMLTRRAAGIHPHRPVAGTKVVSIAPIHAAPSRSARLTLAAAITVLVVGAAALFVAAGGDPAPGSGPGRVSEAAGGPRGVIWPAPESGVMPPATPVSSAASYIFAATAYTGGLVEPVTSRQGNRATVAYDIGDGGPTVTVSMRRSEDAWYVTGSATDHLRIAQATAFAGVVTADIDPVSYRTSFTVLKAELIGSDGAVLDSTRIDDLVMPPTIQFLPPLGTTPLAVQLTEVPQDRPGLPGVLGIGGLASQKVSLS